MSDLGVITEPVVWHVDDELLNKLIPSLLQLQEEELLVLHLMEIQDGEVPVVILQHVLCQSMEHVALHSHVLLVYWIQIAKRQHQKRVIHVDVTMIGHVLVPMVEQINDVLRL